MTTSENAPTREAVGIFFNADHLKRLWLWPVVTPRASGPTSWGCSGRSARWPARSASSMTAPMRIPTPRRRRRSRSSARNRREIPLIRRGAACLVRGRRASRVPRWRLGRVGRCIARRDRRRRRSRNRRGAGGHDDSSKRCGILAAAGRMKVIFCCSYAWPIPRREQQAMNILTRHSGVDVMRSSRFPASPVSPAAAFQPTRKSVAA